MNEQIEQTAMDILKVYLAQMDSALKISKIVCEHSDREEKELTGDDIICGLVYRLMVPMSQEEIQQSMKEADSILEGSDSEDEEYDTIEELYEKPTVSRKIKSNQCNCDICSQVRVCLCNYKEYEPNDQLALRFKNSIQETCDTHKIYI
tara:strand:+ start:874 stop:1320 length:447 start_codon:yes stop_codon:yes gene_type:complete